MKHLIICREYPPAPGGGIGVYVEQYSRWLAESGDTVHVIGQLWCKAASTPEIDCGGRRIVHRIPYESGVSFLPRRPHPTLNQHSGRALFASDTPTQCFSWLAAQMAESLVENEGIELIEAQEYEAPLYCFQLRRALGMGPERRPPCVIHLHSPTEFIARHNGWEICAPGVLVAKRFEDYSIAAADALLSPSAFLARQVESHYGLAAGAVEVIPYPLGETRSMTRSTSVWEEGSIIFVGRLEARKGILEWIDATVAVAREHSNAVFDFIGSDTIYKGESVLAAARRRIPAKLRSRFRFFGEVPRHALPQHLARARIAAVPSRWENFPNVCMEAMASGIPVIASREGGMSEMIEDGRTGWLSPTQSASDLANTLRKALETPSGVLIDMGDRAATEIRRICDKSEVIRARQASHRNVALRGATRSVRLPCRTSSRTVCRSSHDAAARHGGHQDNSPAGVSLVITCERGNRDVNDFVRHLSLQTERPAAVYVATYGSTATGPSGRDANAWPPEVRGLPGEFRDAVSARNVGLAELLRQEFPPLGVAFLSPHDRLRSDYVALCVKVLNRCPDVGLVSGWSARCDGKNRAWARPCPAFPFQWTSNDAAPFCVFRTEAVREVGDYRTEVGDGYAHWDLCNAVLAQGWSGVTIPDFLVDNIRSEEAFLQLAGCSSATRATLLGRFPELVAFDAQEILRFAFPMNGGPYPGGRSSWRDQLRYARFLLQHPQSTVKQLYRRLKNRLLHRG